MTVTAPSRGRNGVANREAVGVRPMAAMGVIRMIITHARRDNRSVLGVDAALDVHGITRLRWGPMKVEQGASPPRSRNTKR